MVVNPILENVWKIIFEHLLQPLRSHTQLFGTLGNFWKSSLCPANYSIVQREGGVPDDIILVHAKFQNLWTTPPHRKLRAKMSEREKWTLCFAWNALWQRTNFARTNNIPLSLTENDWFPTQPPDTLSLMIYIKMRLPSSAQTITLSQLS
jgi:hypothetical protein